MAKDFLGITVAIGALAHIDAKNYERETEKQMAESARSLSRDEKFVDTVHVKWFIEKEIEARKNSAALQTWALNTASGADLRMMDFFYDPKPKVELIMVQGDIFSGPIFLDIKERETGRYSFKFNDVSYNINEGLHPRVQADKALNMATDNGDGITLEESITRKTIKEFIKGCEFDGNRKKCIIFTSLGKYGCEVCAKRVLRRKWLAEHGMVVNIADIV